MEFVAFPTAQSFLQSNPRDFFGHQREHLRLRHLRRRRWWHNDALLLLCGHRSQPAPHHCLRSHKRRIPGRIMSLCADRREPPTIPLQRSRRSRAFERSERARGAGEGSARVLPRLKTTVRDLDRLGDCKVRGDGGADAP